jgi:hypothetical protein
MYQGRSPGFPFFIAFSSASWRTMARDKIAVKSQRGITVAGTALDFHEVPF